MVTTTAHRLFMLVLVALLAGTMTAGVTEALGTGHAAKGRSKAKSKKFPPGPSAAKLQQLECAKFSCTDKHQILKLKILTRGTPRHGTGISHQRGGDDVPRKVIIYPMLISYDETAESGYYTGGGYNPLVWHTYTETTHWREKDNLMRDGVGAWVIRFQSASSTCEPRPTACPANIGGGA